MTIQEFFRHLQNDNRGDFIRNIQNDTDGIKDTNSGRIGDFFDKFKNLSQSKSSPIRNSGGGGGGVTGEVIGYVNDQLQKFSSKSIYGEPQSNLPGSDEFFKTIEKNGLSINTLLGLTKVTIESIVEQIATEAELQTKVNESMGVTGSLSMDIRDAMLQSSEYAMKFGYGLQDVRKVQQNITESTGKFNLISKEQMDRASETARAYVGELSQMGEVFNSFEKVGIGATKAMDEINNAGLKSLNLGLRSKTTVKDITDNLGKLNEYGFKNGVQGLADMSRKASEFRLSMSEVFKVAEKVFSPEGAIDLAANLQVLGGAIGDFNDPLKLMYDATNNVEGLQDAIIKTAGSLATYNQEQGRFEITGINLRRAKEMSNQLGISMDELGKSAIASQERLSGLAAISASAFGGGMKDDEKEFLLNMSRMDKGEMKISIPPNLREQLTLKEGETQLSLKDLTKEQTDLILKYRNETKDMKPEEIAKAQFHELTQIKMNIDMIANSQVIKGSKAVMGKGPNRLNLGERLKTISGMVSQQADYISKDVNAPEALIKKVNDLVGEFTQSDMYKSLDKMEKIAEKWGKIMYEGIKSGLNDGLKFKNDMVQVKEDSKGYHLIIEIPDSHGNKKSYTYDFKK